MELKRSEAQGRHREMGSEGSVEQKNTGRWTRPGFEAYGAGRAGNNREVKNTGGKSGGRVSKVIQLIAGDLPHVTET